MIKNCNFPYMKDTRLVEKILPQETNVTVLGKFKK